jgi:hypothetical protein
VRKPDHAIAFALLAIPAVLLIAQGYIWLMDGVWPWLSPADVVAALGGSPLAWFSTLAKIPLIGGGLRWLFFDVWAGVVPLILGCLTFWVFAA